MQIALNIAAPPPTGGSNTAGAAGDPATVGAEGLLGVFGALIGGKGDELTSEATAAGQAFAEALASVLLPPPPQPAGAATPAASTSPAAAASPTAAAAAPPLPLPTPLSLPAAPAAEAAYAADAAGEDALPQGGFAPAGVAPDTDLAPQSPARAPPTAAAPPAESAPASPSAAQTSAAATPGDGAATPPAVKADASPQPAAQPAQASAPPAAAAPQAPAPPPAKAAERPMARAEARQPGRNDTAHPADPAPSPAGVATAKSAVAPVQDAGASQDPAGQGGLDAGAEADLALDQAEAPARTEAAPAPASAASGAGAGLKAEPVTFLHLASQIVQKLTAKVTRFDLELLPHGLGKVDVKIEISPSGALSAALSFDNPQAAAELRGRSEELRTALQQAGFDLSDKGLSFNLSGEQQRWAQERRDNAEAFARRAFSAATDVADDLLTTVAEAAARLERRGDGALDIRI